ncbi:MAG: hypothetical protein AAF824_23145 [Bacteroidota bacterium]
MLQIILATFIILSVSHYVLTNWLTNFAYHIQIEWWSYPVATSLLLVVVLMAISVQVFKAIQLNPANLLRQE